MSADAESCRRTKSRRTDPESSREANTRYTDTRHRWKTQSGWYSNRGNTMAQCGVMTFTGSR